MPMDWMTGTSHTIIILLLLRQDLLKIFLRVKRVSIEMKNGNGAPKEPE